MKRTRYLVAYDIRDDRRLRRVHKVVQGFGFSFQYSVFICDLTSLERMRFIDAVSAVVEPRFDRVALVTLGEGGSGDMFWFLGQRSPLPDSGPLIV